MNRSVWITGRKTGKVRDQRHTRHKVDAAMNEGSLNGNAPHTYSWKLAQTQQTEGRQKCRGPQLMMMMMMMTKEEHLFYNNSLSSRRTFCHPPLPLHLSNSRLDGESTWSSSYSIICLCFLAGHNSTQHRERMKVDGWMDPSPFE